MTEIQFRCLGCQSVSHLVVMDRPTDPDFRTECDTCGFFEWAEILEVKR